MDNSQLKYCIVLLLAPDPLCLSICTASSQSLYLDHNLPRVAIQCLLDQVFLVALAIIIVERGRFVEVGPWIG